METHNLYILIGAIVGLLVGLLVAEIFFKKSAKHTNHVVPATIIRNSQHIVQQKLVYYATLSTFIGAQFFLNIKIPDLCYSLIVFAIVGGDIQKLATKFFRLK